MNGVVREATDNPAEAPGIVDSGAFPRDKKRETTNKSATMPSNLARSAPSVLDWTANIVPQINKKTPVDDLSTCEKRLHDSSIINKAFHALTRSHRSKNTSHGVTQISSKTKTMADKEGPVYRRIHAALRKHMEESLKTNVQYA